MPWYVKRGCRELCQCVYCLAVDLLVKGVAEGRRVIARKKCNCFECGKGLGLFHSAVDLRRLVTCEKRQGVVCGIFNASPALAGTAG